MLVNMLYADTAPLWLRAVVAVVGTVLIVLVIVWCKRTQERRD